MKRFTFGTFRVDEGNREAYEVCLQVANLNFIEPQPIVLMGEFGSGKTHLLYSIVNRIRAGTTRAGIAYVTAYDFPDKVRALVDDPAPIRKTRKAVLLVDQLEEFGDLVDDLEAIVRLFLDCGHCVVLGTSIHPKRLINITPGLAEIAAKGKILLVRATPPDTKASMLQQQLAQEHQAELARHINEIRDLRRMLEDARQHMAQVSEIEIARWMSKLSAAVDAIDAARNETSAQLLLLQRIIGDIKFLIEDETSSLAFGEESAQRLALVEAELDRITVEREAIAAERDGLRTRLETVERTREELRTERDRLLEELQTLRRPEAQDKPLEASLSEREESHDISSE
ncbi:MAG TPA: DnaA/Hda family protein [Candidatus Hydrogenedentes bacterium]|nr:DnaA/Hda family protein [Candidatus Hydrogenedentota bacterium]HOL75865.1 DnaA/Hda family protein [Candidatus Hydrogenedentota bacterium]HPO86366.1 DnaA/Hda family protein [Candidatus Hydrogenedentota bacterium]